MNTFNEGDRVSHPINGEGTMINPYDGTGWPTVQFDSGLKLMTDENLLTPVPATPADRFKAGDLVHHAHHGPATVTDVDPALKLVTIQPTFYRGGELVRVHPVSLTHEPKPSKFTVAVTFEPSGGFATGGTVTTIMNRRNAEEYLTNLPDWDTVESITINRVKGN